MASIRKEIHIDAPVTRGLGRAARRGRAAHQAGAGLRHGHAHGRQRAHRHLRQRHGGARGDRQRRRAAGIASAGRSSTRPSSITAPRPGWNPKAMARSFCWTADLLPDELAGRVEGMMDAGIQVIQKTLESTAAN